MFLDILFITNFSKGHTRNKLLGAPCDASKRQCRKKAPVILWPIRHLGGLWRFQFRPLWQQARRSLSSYSTRIRSGSQALGIQFTLSNFKVYFKIFFLLGPNHCKTVLHCTVLIKTFDSKQKNSIRKKTNYKSINQYNNQYLIIDWPSCVFLGRYLLHME